MLPKLLSRLIRYLPVFVGLSILLLLLTAGRSAASPGTIDGSSFFQEAPEYSSGAPDAYQVVVADLNWECLFTVSAQPVIKSQEKAGQIFLLRLR